MWYIWANQSLVFWWESVDHALFGSGFNEEGANMAASGLETVGSKHWSGNDFPIFTIKTNENAVFLLDRSGNTYAPSPIDQWNALFLPERSVGKNKR